MDAIIIKDKNEYIAFSLNPVGVVGWGNSKNLAISQLNDNLYDYCNWLGCKLPKEPESKVVGEYSGEISKIKFLQGDEKAVKKYCEVAYQTAFSYKLTVDGFQGYDHPLHRALLKRFNLSEEKGIIGFASELCGGEDCAKLREFIFITYKTAKEICIEQKANGVEVTNYFKFDL